MKIKFGFYEVAAGHQKEAGKPPFDLAIITWRVKSGDAIKQGDLLLRFETDKVTMDLESPAAGTIEIREKYVEDGSEWIAGPDSELLPDGRTLFLPHLGVIETGSSPVGTESDSLETESVVMPTPLSPTPKSKISSVARNIMERKGVSEEKITARFPDKRIGKADLEKFIAERDSQSEDSAPVAEGAQAVPAARELARKEGIDLADVPGSEPDGLIRLQDVEQAIATAGQAAEAGTVPASADDLMAIDTVKPSRLRLAIAREMQAALEIPTACASKTYSLAILKWFKRVFGARFEESFGVRLHIWLPLVYALVRVLAQEEFRYFNARWNKDTETIECYKHVNMGISLGTEEGLRILVIPMSEKRDIGSFAREIDAIFTRAAQKSLTLADLRNNTFIFNNVGGLGHERGNSILPRGIAGMLNFGSINQETCMATLELFFDHRVFDGYPVGKFMTAVYEDMEEYVIPELIKNLSGE